jgi:hypothetical protein
MNKYQIISSPFDQKLKIKYNFMKTLKSKSKIKTKMKKLSYLISSAAKIMLLSAMVIMNAAPVALASHEEVTLTVKNPDPYTGNQSWFVYTKNPGDLIEDIATIKNYGSSTSIVRIYPVDAMSSQSGSFILKFEHDDQEGIGEWTSVSRQEIKIAPDERIDVPFKIKIPQDISPGQYIGGIVIEYGPNVTQGNVVNCTNGNNCGNSIVAVKTRIGSRIYITIPGQVEEKIDLTDFNYFTTLTGQSRFNFTIVNRGNVVYQPVAEITIRDSSGKVYDTFTKPLGISMPDTTIQPVITWDKQRPLVANFSATAKVTFPRRFQIAGENLHGSPVLKTIDFLIIPWDHIFYLSIIALIATGLCAMHSLKLKKMITGSEKYLVQENDDLVSIASAKKISWKRLVEINRLHPPYVLKKGMTLFVPKPPKKKS